MSTDKPTPGQEILRIADEIRVRIHLAGMEAKDAWAKLEPKVTDFQSKLEKVAGQAGDELDKIAAGLHRELQSIKEKVFDR
jgi:hypothetical protein